MGVGWGGLGQAPGAGTQVLGQMGSCLFLARDAWHRSGAAPSARQSWASRLPHVGARRVRSAQAGPFPSLNLFLIWKRRGCSMIYLMTPGAQKALSGWVIVVIIS